MQHGAIYSVAIETLVNEIYKEHQASLKPVNDDPLLVGILTDMKAALALHQNDISPEANTIFIKNWIL